MLGCKFEELKDTLVQFIKFGIIGVSNTIISLIVYYLFINIDSAYYMIGNVVGWLVSVLNAFYWNNKYVFKSDNHSWRNTVYRLLKTYLSYGGTFLLSTALLWIEINLIGCSEWIAPMINLIITIPLNFILNKFWTFR